MGVLKVFTAGVAIGIASVTAEKYERRYGDKPDIIPGGSVELVNRIKSGEECDIFISADDTILEPMLIPDYISGYLVFAANRMVVAANPGHSIDSSNWEQKLCDSKATFAHMDPYKDPSGYRAVMSMMLADNYKPGLSEKLLNHPGHIGSAATFGLEKLSDFNYIFTYGSAAVKQGLPYAILPPVMDLSDEKYEQIYNTAVFKIDEDHSVRGSTINHALAVTNSSAGKDSVKEFIDLFLENDLASFGFTPKHKIYGEFPY